MNTNNPEEKDEIYHLDVFLAGFLFLGGLLLGNLTGAGAMLLLAPRSGKKTRRQIRRKGRKVRKQTVKTVQHKVGQVHNKANHLTINVQEQAEELQRRGQDVVDDQKERWESVVEAGITAVQGT